MACPDEDAIADFVGGTMPGERRGAVEEHLAGCEDCRALVSEMARDLTAREFTLVDAAELAPAEPLERPAFIGGDRIADRYEIVRFVAEGGMGEVYEAHDLELSSRVALKTIRGDVAEAPRMLARFKREIYLARKVTHPNVCRIFDMGFHVVRGRRIAFLTMEFLDGETLAQRIERQGRLSTGEALPMVTQMAAALAAAHHEGVIHRDFKSHNVMLVARGSSLRVVVTDFGLARSAADDAPNASATASAANRPLVGSPAYMSPEQAAGGVEITSAADVYALGVVMFEMVTGQWPFLDRSAVRIAMKRLTEPAPSPRNVVPDLDRRWEATILRCLEREPAARFASVDEIPRALAHGVPRPPRARAAAYARLVWAACALAAVAIGGMLALRSLRHAPPVPVSASVPVPVSAPTSVPVPAPAPVPVPVPVPASVSAPAPAPARKVAPAKKKPKPRPADPFVTDYPIP